LNDEEPEQSEDEAAQEEEEQEQVPSALDDQVQEVLKVQLPL
jgi:hypothetical protein